MTDLLERAVQRAKALPDYRQDEVGEILLALVEQDSSGLHLSESQQTEVRRRLAHPESPVPADEMKAFFRTLAG